MKGEGERGRGRRTRYDLCGMEDLAISRREQRRDELVLWEVMALLCSTGADMAIGASDVSCDTAAVA